MRYAGEEPAYVCLADAVELDGRRRMNASRRRHFD
jgi:hypothetical protein